MITNPINAIINYNYFCMNFKHDFIEQCWKDDIHLIHHLREKFLELYQRKGTALMPYFFCELDFDNQIKLSKWINKNYISFSHLNDK